MKPFDAILFDLDGTLIDSEPIGLRALDVYLARYGHVAPQGFAARLIGRRATDNAGLLIDHFGLPLTVEAVIEEERMLIEAMVEQECEPMPHADALVRSLRRRGIRAAVATSSLRSYLTMVLRKFGWADLFDATVTGDEIAVGKPAPDIFLRAAELLDVPPARCLVLEDAPHGVAAGLAAGAIVRAVPNAVTSDLEFPAGAVKLASLADVLAWLDAEEAPR